MPIIIKIERFSTDELNQLKDEITRELQYRISPPGCREHIGYLCPGSATCLTECYNERSQIREATFEQQMSMVEAVGIGWSGPKVGPINKVEYEWQAPQPQKDFRSCMNQPDYLCPEECENRGENCLKSIEPERYEAIRQGEEDNPQPSMFLGKRFTKPE